MFKENKIKLIIKKTLPIIIVGLLMASSFLLGVFFGSGQIKQIGPIKLPAVIINKEVGQTNQVDFKLFWDAWGELEKNFVGDVDYQKMLYGAIKGMSQSLGDPYTVYLDPNEAKDFSEEIEGSFSGIGIEVGVKNKELVVISAVSGTPAERSGLKPKDKILKIDGKDTSEMSFDEAVRNIRGPEGTEVTLLIQRGDSDSKEYKIKREIIKVESVKLEYKDTNAGKVAYIRILQFNEDVVDRFNKVVDDILISQPEGIILDLRGNSGGYFDKSLDVASEFFDGGVITIEQFKNGKKKEHNATGKGRLTNQKLIVLIDEGSASASEIVAGAIKDRSRGKIVGVKSFGKGLVQSVIKFDNDLNKGILKITTSKWLTPKEKSINNEGIEPDVKKELTEDDFNNFRDPQLDEALKII